MLARHDGAIVLISGAIPGETVEAVVEKVHRGTIWAATERVLETSPDRIASDDDGACGGNVYAHVRYDRQLDLKREVLRDAFARLGRIALDQDIPITPSPIDGYRMRARLHWRNGRIGFFREGTHDLCDAGATRQLLPATVDALEALSRALVDSSSSIVSEIELSENCPATERTCHLELVANADPLQLANARVDAFTGGTCGFPGQSRPLTLWGLPIVNDVFDFTRADAAGGKCTVRLSRHARAFFQGNRYLLPDLLSHVVDATLPGAIVDLYAGVGLFSVALAACGRGNVVAIEGDRISADDLKQNASPFSGMLHPRHQSVEKFLAGRHDNKRIATVIVDPPRTGMTRDALKGAIGLNAGRVVYVSCDVATLARDARMLVDARYRLTSLRAFDLFPNTAHVETVVTFDRE